MDNKSYIYPIYPDDPKFQEKTSVVKCLDETYKEIREIRRDKGNLFLFLMTIIISLFIGFFTQSKNFVMMLLFLNGLTTLIIWRVNPYRKEEFKLNKFFNKMENLRRSLEIPKIPL